MTMCNYVLSILRVLPRLQGSLQKPCEWSWSAAIMTSGSFMFQTRRLKLRDSLGVTRF